MLPPWVASPGVPAPPLSVAGSIPAFFSFWVLPTWATCNTCSSTHRGGFSPFLITCYPLKLLLWTRPVTFRCSGVQLCSE